MSIYYWLIIALVVLFILIMLMALVSAGPQISPDEEARLLAEEKQRRELKKANRQRGKLK